MKCIDTTTQQVTIQRSLLRNAMLGVLLLAASQPGTAWSANKASAGADSKLSERVMALNTVQNLFGRYQFYHVANLYDDARYVDLFATDPDTKIQTSRGIWQGKDAAKRITSYYSKHAPAEAYAGELHAHPVSTPVIEVAGDGQTARGVWMSDGIEAGVRNGAVNAQTLWLKYCVDFKKMDGQWKIWHLNTVPVFMNQYGDPLKGGMPSNMGAAAAPGAPGGAAGGPPPVDPNMEKFKADRPNNNMTQSMYNASTVQVLEPVPPTPYETWNDSMSCIK